MNLQSGARDIDLAVVDGAGDGNAHQESGDGGDVLHFGLLGGFGIRRKGVCRKITKRAWYR